MVMRALIISAIVFVAVVMGLGTIAPVLLPQAEAHIAGRLRAHDTNAGPGHDGGESHSICTFGQAIFIAGLLHYIDANRNEKHEPTEIVFCLPIRG